MVSVSKCLEVTYRFSTLGNTKYLFLTINISVQKYKNIYGLGTSLVEAFYHNFDQVFCTVPNLIDSSNQQLIAVV